jgi:hypothetical protein
MLSSTEGVSYSRSLKKTKLSLSLESLSWRRLFNWLRCILVNWTLGFSSGGDAARPFSIKLADFRLANIMVRPIYSCLFRTAPAY